MSEFTAEPASPPVSGPVFSGYGPGGRPPFWRRAGTFGAVLAAAGLALALWVLFLEIRSMGFDFIKDHFTRIVRFDEPGFDGEDAAPTAEAADGEKKPRYRPGSREALFFDPVRGGGALDVLRGLAVDEHPERPAFLWHWARQELDAHLDWRSDGAPDFPFKAPFDGDRFPPALIPPEYRPVPDSDAPASTQTDAVANGDDDDADDDDDVSDGDGGKRSPSEGIPTKAGAEPSPAAPPVPERLAALVETLRTMEPDNGVGWWIEAAIDARRSIGEFTPPPIMDDSFEADAPSGTDAAEASENAGNAKGAAPAPGRPEFYCASVDAGVSARAARLLHRAVGCRDFTWRVSEWRERRRAAFAAPAAEEERPHPIMAVVERMERELGEGVSFYNELHSDKTRRFLGEARRRVEAGFAVEPDPADGLSAFDVLRDTQTLGVRTMADPDSLSAQLGGISMLAFAAEDGARLMDEAGHPDAAARLRERSFRYARPYLLARRVNESRHRRLKPHAISRADRRPVPAWQKDPELEAEAARLAGPEFDAAYLRLERPNAGLFFGLMLAPNSMVSTPADPFWPSLDDLTASRHIFEPWLFEAGARGVALTLLAMTLVGMYFGRLWRKLRAGARDGEPPPGTPAGDASPGPWRIVAAVATTGGMLVLLPWFLLDGPGQWLNVYPGYEERAWLEENVMRCFVAWILGGSGALVVLMLWTRGYVRGASRRWLGEYAAPLSAKPLPANPAGGWRPPVPWWARVAPLASVALWLTGLLWYLLAGLSLGAAVADPGGRASGGGNALWIAAGVAAFAALVLTNLSGVHRNEFCAGWKNRLESRMLLPALGGLVLVVGLLWPRWNGARMDYWEGRERLVHKTVGGDAPGMEGLLVRAWAERAAKLYADEDK